MIFSLRFYYWTTAFNLNISSFYVFLILLLLLVKCISCILPMYLGCAFCTFNKMRLLIKKIII